MDTNNGQKLGTANSIRYHPIDLPVLTQEDFGSRDLQLERAYKLRDELRTKRQAQQMIVSKKNKQSKYIGVHTYTRLVKNHKNKKVQWITSWSVQISFAAEIIYIGTYYNEKEAALAYDKAKMQLFGKYARTNQMIYPEDFK